MRRRQLALWTTLMMILSLTTPVAGTNNLGGQKWDQQQNGIYNYSPRYYYPDSSMSTSCRSRFTNGATAWNNVGRELYFASGSGYSKWIKVKMGDLAWPNNGAYAFVRVDPFGDVSDADVNFNSDVDLPNGSRAYPYCGTGTPPFKYYDLWGTAAHELGHTIVLNHSSAWADTMYTYGDHSGTSDATRFRTLTTHDQDGIKAKYAAAS